MYVLQGFLFKIFVDQKVTGVVSESKFVTVHFISAYIYFLYYYLCAFAVLSLVEEVVTASKLQACSPSLALFGSSDTMADGGPSQFKRI